MSLAKLTRLILLMFLSCFMHRADGQVTFHYNQGPQEIDIRCDVGSLSLTNLSYLDSLVISKLDKGQWHVLASLSAHYAQNGPVSHVQDAEVNGQVSSTGASSSFLGIHWDNAQPKLDGDYKCEAYGVDSDMIPTSIKQELKIKVENAELLFYTTLEKISIGLSPTLDINCSVGDLNALNMSELASLSILRIHEGVEQLMADIKSGHDVSVKPGSDSVFSRGYLDPNEGFIAMGWSSPGLDQAGEYICEVSGNDAEGHPVFLSRRKNITWEEPSREKFIYRIVEMYRTKTDLENRLAEMNQTKSDLENRLDKTEKMATGLNKTVYAKSCDDLSLSEGQHVVTLYPDNDGPLLVVCDVKSPNETWTIFQKRFDGSVKFYRNFSQYENGFGCINGEHWLGLKHIKRLLDASGNNHELRVDMVQTWYSTPYTRIYPTFAIGPGDNYTLTVAGYDDGGNGMSYNNGTAFATYDQGPWQYYASQSRYTAGWWLESGTNVNLNGVWGDSGTYSSIWWWEFGHSRSDTLSATEMKFRSSD